LGAKKIREMGTKRVGQEKEKFEKNSFPSDVAHGSQLKKAGPAVQLIETESGRRERVEKKAE